MYKTEKFDASAFEPKRFESDHTITIRGQEIAYHTVCEDNVFYDNAGKAIATLFSYSYFNKTDKNPNRPITEAPAAVPCMCMPDFSAPRGSNTAMRWTAPHPFRPMR